jgi:hypothetical protein
MIVNLLYKEKLTGTEYVISKDVLSEHDLCEFYINTGSSRLGTSELIKLFDYFYNMDINDYSFHDIFLIDNSITLYLSKEDFTKIQRENKINSLLNN